MIWVIFSETRFSFVLEGNSGTFLRIDGMQFYQFLTFRGKNTGPTHNFLKKSNFELVCSHVINMARPLNPET